MTRYLLSRNVGAIIRFRRVSISQISVCNGRESAEEPPMTIVNEPDVIAP